MRYKALSLLIPFVLIACDTPVELVGEPEDNAEPNAYAELVLGDAPLAYWRFEETTGAGIDDSSTNEFFAVFVGRPRLGQTLDAKLGNAIEFDDSFDGVVNCCQETYWSNLNAMTAEVWIRPETLFTPEGQIVVDKGSTWNLFITPEGHPAFQFPGTIPPTTYGNTRLVVGQKYHLVGTFANEIMRLYVNGELVDEVDTNRFIDNRDTPIHVARGLSDARFDFYGIVDEVAIYNRALSADAIRRHYDAGR